MKRTITLIVASLVCMAALSAHALEIKGIKLDDAVEVAGSPLLLNGAGFRIKFGFKVFAAGLYLMQKNSDANAVINDTGNKRIIMHFMRDVSSEALVNGMNEGFVENNSAAEIAAIDSQMKAFDTMMSSSNEVKKSERIVLDLTSAGTRVSLNGKVLGNIEGEAFNRALLRVWLGNKPVDAPLKKALLGN